MDSRICSLVSHFLSLTSSRSIWPTSATGPPKPRKPRRKKYSASSVMRPRFGTVVLEYIKLLQESCRQRQQTALPHRSRCLSGRRQNGLTDTEWQRTWALDDTDDGENHEEVDEIVRGPNPAQSQRSPRPRSRRTPRRPAE